MTNIGNVEEYFLQIEPLLEESKLVGGPVYVPNQQAEVGIISAYNSDTGFARIKLFDTVNYVDLLKSGVPLEHIVFKNEA